MCHPVCHLGGPIPEDAALMAEGSTQPFAWSASAIRPDRNDARTTGTAHSGARTVAGPTRAGTSWPRHPRPDISVAFDHDLVGVVRQPVEGALREDRGVEPRDPLVDQPVAGHDRSFPAVCWTRAGHAGQTESALASKCPIFLRGEGGPPAFSPSMLRALVFTPSPRGDPEIWFQP